MPIISLSSPMHTCFLLGHRGARAEMLENSQLGFAYAQRLRLHNQGLDGIEFDVQITADQQLVVVHDDCLQRLTGQQSFIRDLTLAQLQANIVSVYQSDWQKFAQTGKQVFLSQPILALAQLLPYLSGYRHIELEVKTHLATDYYALAQALGDILQDPMWQALPITITSFDTMFLTVWQSFCAHAQLPFSRGLLLASTTTLSSEIAFFPQSIQQISDVCNLACRLGCEQIGVYFGLIRPELIAIAHAYALKVTAWTVNDIGITKRLLAWHIDTLITDVPTSFLEQLA